MLHWGTPGVDSCLLKVKTDRQRWCLLAFSDPPKPVLYRMFAHDSESGTTCDCHHHRLEEGARSSSTAQFESLKHCRPEVSSWHPTPPWEQPQSVDTIQPWRFTCALTTLEGDLRDKTHYNFPRSTNRRSMTKPSLRNQNLTSSVA